MKSNKYTTNTLWLLSERLIRLILFFLINILIARYLGPEEFGVLNYVISLVGLLIPISLLGFDVVLVREMVVHKRLKGQLFVTAFCMMIAVSVVVVIIIWIYADIFEKNNLAILIQIYSLTLLFNPVYVIDYFYQANVMVKYSAIAFFLQSILSAIFKLYLLSVEASLYWFVIALVIDSVLLLIFFGGILLIRKDLANEKLSFNKTVALVLFRRSLPLIFSGLMVTVYMKIDQVMLMWLVDGSAVGTYAAAVRLSEAWYFVPVGITASLFPMIINCRNIHEKYIMSIQKLMDSLVLLSLGVALIFYVFSDQIINIVYGNEYLPSEAILQVHAWTGIFVSLGLISGKWLVAENLHYYTLYRTLAGATVNIILNYVLIPKYGTIGAATATLIAQISSTFIFDIFFAKTREMFMLKLNTLLFLTVLNRAKNYIKKIF